MKSTKRVLAVDPTPKGFGWIVFEGPDRLIDWGIVYVSPINNPRCLQRFVTLMDRYPPDIVVLERLGERGPRRSMRVQQLIVSAEKLAKERGCRVRTFSRHDVRQTFAEASAWNKDQIAREIALKHRELTPWLPPIRKIWMSEDHRMAIFDAAALAHTFFHRYQRRRKPPARRQLRYAA